jgi:molecular chaperone GrpE (heat shock protein)
MGDAKKPELAKWPFLLGDLLLLGLAYLIFAKSQLPLGAGQIVSVILCVTAGAACMIAPFVFEYRASVRLAEANTLTTVVAQIRNLEQVAAQISQATGQWQFIQEAADKTAAAAREIAQRMGDEARAFTEFMQKANEGEKATLRLETEKLRRAEGDWVQVLIRMLDHVYALHQGAIRSGQTNLIEQVGNFQNACRDAARRVGVTPFTAEQAEPFDTQKHQLIDDAKPAANALVGETLAAGYTFQGRLLRPALVRLQEDTPARKPAKSAS